MFGIGLASLFSDWSHEIATAVLPEFLASLGITAAWLAYHEKYVSDESLPDDEERQLLGALVAISTGVEDATKLNVPAEVGLRLLRCYDDLRKE